MTGNGKCTDRGPSLAERKALRARETQEARLADLRYF